MTSKDRSRAGGSRYQFSETGHFMATMPDRQWILHHHGRTWRPPTDVYETEDNIVVKVEVAGMAEDDFAITFSEGALVVAGVRHDPSTKLGYHQMEIPYGEFRTDVYVSAAIDVDNIEASYTDGFLLVNLPKAKSHHVTIGRK
jgi:HSP20 family protein